ncbi:MAG: UDP-N-acetylmuramoyl-tripeptide--D-alanyl-D-alanine ligase [Proteobacteria bacterium]|nr:UDP-N-acetylmuramoyl-tripeptide--D-alanyl-D-alanine ligase [Pseudomonadota bacterium]
MPPLWSAEDLREATGGAMGAPFAASGVSIDTRTIEPGDLFVALQGENGDGHAHVADAFARGAAGAMVHRPVPGHDRLLMVEDTLAGLARLGGFGRARFTGRVVAVTGSVGKTTTKEMLRTALSPQGKTHAAVASYNNQWGLPLTLARIPRDAAFCVAEIGMNHAGEIAPLARLARPHVAVITAIAPAHIGHLGSIEAIAAEKGSICEGLPDDGVAVLPADTPMLPILRQAAGGRRVVTFGESGDADARLLSAEGDAEGSTVTLSLAGEMLSLRLPAPGRHMAMNALAALTAVAALRADPRAGAAALAGFQPMQGRGLRRRLALPGGEALLLDESYNANPASLRAALSVLAVQPAGRRVAVVGDMLELGEVAPAEHLALAGPVLDAADLVFACGPQMRALHAALPAGRQGGWAADAAALAPLVAAALRPGDAVLVKGSLGIGMRRIVAALDARAQSAAGRADAGATQC